MGDVLRAQDKLMAAKAAFDEYLAISRMLAKQDPSNALWQRDLAVAHSKVGAVLETQGQLNHFPSGFSSHVSLKLMCAQRQNETLCP